MFWRRRRRCGAVMNLSPMGHGPGTRTITPLFLVTVVRHVHASLRSHNTITSTAIRDLSGPLIITYIYGFHESFKFLTQSEPINDCRLLFLLCYRYIGFGPKYVIPCPSLFTAFPTYYIVAANALDPRQTLPPFNIPASCTSVCAGALDFIVRICSFAQLLFNRLTITFSKNAQPYLTHLAAPRPV